MTATNNKCFKIFFNEVENRIDPNPYNPIRLNTIKKIKKTKYELLPLKEVALFKKETTKQNKENLPYLGLENIESNTGKFISSLEKKESFGTASKFKKGNILFPRLRPYLNKVHLAKFDGYCSTEFYILEVQKCLSEYLFAFLISNLIVNQTSYLITGNTLPRLQTKDVENLLIPIPPKKTQEQIIKIMGSAYKEKRQKENQADELLNSIDDYTLNKLGIKMPETKDKICFAINSKEATNRLDSHYNQPKFKEIKNAFEKGKYKTKEFEGVIKNINYGTIPKDYSNTGIPLLKIGNLKPNEIITNELSYIPDFPEEKDKQKITQKDDLLISQLGTVGITAPITKKEEGFLYGSFILRLQILQGNPMFFSIILNSSIGKTQFQRDMTTATVRANTSIPAVKSIKIPIPPLAIQNKIAEGVKNRNGKAKKLKSEAESAIKNAKEKIEKIILT